MADRLVEEIEQSSLKWTYDGMEGWMVEWIIEPDASIIAELAERHLAPESEGKKVEVSFLVKGGFNKIYDVRVGEEESARYIFRVSLPVDPFHKTESKVATLDYVKTHTIIPVPGVVAYDSSAINTLGFEWTLMDKVPGIRLEEAWLSMSWEAKESLTKEVTDMTMSLHRASFSSIGSLYFDGEADMDMIVDSSQPIDQAGKPNLATDPLSLKRSLPVRVGRLVDRTFLRGQRIFVKMDRGPYESDREYMDANIDVEVASLGHLLDAEPIREDLIFVANNIKENFEGSDDESEEKIRENIKATITACQEMHEEISRTFTVEAAPQSHESDETTSTNDTRFLLMHTDLSARNIIIDPQTNRINGIVDWEFAATGPGWQATTYPEFLDSQECEAEELENCHEDMYKERLEFYELTQLRKLYNRTFLEAGFTTPESFNRDRKTRRKRHILELLNNAEESGPRHLRSFLERPDEEYWTTNERFMPGLYVADWGK